MQPNPMVVFDFAERKVTAPRELRLVPPPVEPAARPAVLTNAKPDK